MAWTESCFNRTLEELNVIRDTHPEIQIHVQESDDETEIPQPTYEEVPIDPQQIPIDPQQIPIASEQIPVDANNVHVASEEIPVNIEQTKGGSSILDEIERYSKIAIDKVRLQEID